MRLLNVHTYKLHEFIGTDIPHYAILSHRWENEEVTFQELQAGHGRRMSGWDKIEGCYKRSSSELSEAINSMFRWYQDAETCYAILSDVRPSFNEVNHNWVRQFKSSKWFTRGWTLQELLAPDNVIFFDVMWREIGTKETLQSLVIEITGIHHLFNFAEASVAQRLSWASERETTRVEDAAYCLMGLFGVNMALLYGEGSAAFFRLQLEIMKNSNDESLFAWQDTTIESSGLIAPSPVCFRGSKDIKRLYPPLLPRRPYSMTNNGLEIEVELIPASKIRYPVISPGLREPYLCPLNCVREGNESRLLSPLLFNVDENVQCFSRMICGQLASIDKKDILAESERRQNGREIVFVQQPHLLTRIQPQYTFNIRTRELSTRGYKIERWLANTELGQWAKDSKDGFVLKLYSSSALLLFTTEHLYEEIFILKVSCAASKPSLALQRCTHESTSRVIESLLTQSPTDPAVGVKKISLLPPSTNIWAELEETWLGSGSMWHPRRTFTVRWKKTTSVRQLFEIELMVREESIMRGVLPILEPDSAS